VGGLLYYHVGLGDNCIVFENFAASIGDLMVSQSEFTVHYNVILNIKMYSCISLGKKITKIKIQGNIVERLWHINNRT
jgi:hypothetical protein